MAFFGKRRAKSSPARPAAIPALIESLEDRTLFAFGLTTATGSYTVDTGAGLVFSIARTAPSGSVGDLTSAKLNGTQLEAPFSTSGRYSHYESGLSSSTAVSATVDPNGQWILITCDDTSGVGVIQYYAARKGFNNIYMATYSAGPNSPSPGEMRFITYTNPSVLTNIPAPSNNAGSTGAIESSDIFGHADGTTSSKYYGEYRAIDTQTYGMTGNGFGEFMNIGNRETSSGGPFYKDIDFQNNELYTYVFSGHSQTESFRPGLKGMYALEFTTGATPAAPDYSWVDGSGMGSYLTGYVPASGRGTLTGIASGVPSGYQVTVALSNSAAQYWGTPDATTGAYSIAGVLPGTYTETIYQGEQAVGTTTVTVAAGHTTAQNITDAFYTPSAANTIFRIGNWDGTPLGFLNADKITYMHPTDTRMSPWAADSTGLTNFTVGTDPDSAWPMAEWHAETSAAPFVDTDNRITFTLTAAQAATALTLRIGLTRLDSGRPTVNVNSGAWTSAIPSQTSQPSSRGLTTGNWRGNNSIYTYDITTSALHAGTNTIDVFNTSGSTGTLYAGYHIYDAIDLIKTASAYAPAIASVTVTPAGPTMGTNGTRAFTAVAKDASGNVVPANIDWSATRGSIDENGNYVAPATAGSDTITATATATQTPGSRSSSRSSSAISAAVTGTGSTGITVVDPPTLNSFTVNDGNAQRSMVKGLTLAFGSPVTLASGAVTLVLHSSGAAPANVTLATSNPSGDGKTYVVSFSGSSVIGGSLPDGTYDLTVHSASVTDAYGQTLAGGDQTFSVLRLFGDYDGNGTVNNADYAWFKSAYGTSTGQSGFLSLFDYDNNGSINNLDYAQFKLRFGTSLS